jgi:hypothetical protein
MSPRSAKAKGRRLQQEVAARIREVFSLPAEDVKSTTMGDSGIDIRLSNAARKVFPFSVECKNVERMSLWDAWEQAVAHEAKEGLSALIVHRKNNTEALAILRFEDLLTVVKLAGFKG